MVAIVMMASVSVMAQKGEMAGGLNLSYGTEISNLGIGVKYQYNVTNPIRLEGSFDYFLEKDGLKMWDINVNAHYLFPVAEKFNVYPLVGLTYANCGVSGDGFFDLNDNGEWDDDEPSLSGDGSESGSTSSSEGKFGVNLGAGVQYDITSKIAASFEAKYQIISGFNQLVIGVGAIYKF